MDDEEMIRDIVGEMVKRLGYEVEFARDGAETIELFEAAKGTARPFDMVIMDLMVAGGMGGEEAVKRLLEIDPEARVIVSSGYFNDPIISKFREYGFSDVIVKPFTPQELSEVLKNSSRNV